MLHSVLLLEGEVIPKNRITYGIPSGLVIMLARNGEYEEVKKI